MYFSFHNCKILMIPSRQLSHIISLSLFVALVAIDNDFEVVGEGGCDGIDGDNVHLYWSRKLVSNRINLHINSSFISNRINETDNGNDGGIDFNIGDVGDAEFGIDNDFVTYVDDGVDPFSSTTDDDDVDVDVEYCSGCWWTCNWIWWIWRAREIEAFKHLIICNSKLTL